MKKILTTSWEIVVEQLVGRIRFEFIQHFHEHFLLIIEGNGNKDQKGQNWNSAFKNNSFNTKFI